MGAVYVQACPLGVLLFLLPVFSRLLPVFSRLCCSCLAVIVLQQDVMLHESAIYATVLLYQTAELLQDLLPDAGLCHGQIALLLLGVLLL